MSVAQKLYGKKLELGGQTKGLITYMRTDSIRVSQEAMNQAKEYIEKTYEKRICRKICCC